MDTIIDNLDLRQGLDFDSFPWFFFTIFETIFEMKIAQVRPPSNIHH